MSGEPAPELAGFGPARAKLAVMAAGLVLFAAIAGWMLWVTPDESWQAEGAGVIRVALWAVALICPAYAADLGWRLARGTPTLVATQEGLALNSALGVSTFVPWDEIDMIAPVEMSRKLWLGIYLRTPVETLERLGMATRLALAKSHARGMPNFAFRAIRLGTSPQEAAEVLEGIRQGKRDAPASGRPRERTGRGR